MPSRFRHTAVAAVALVGGLAALVWPLTDRPRQPPRFRSDAWWLPNEPLLGFIYVGAGAFTMGSNQGRDSLASDDETPDHRITLPSFFIGRFEVTVDQYKACIEARACPLRDRRTLYGRGDLPARYVSWHDALAYCGWLESQLTGWSGTPNTLADVLLGKLEGTKWHVVLPSEAEWERAARGTDGRVYPWGDHADAARANFAAAGPGGPSAVGAFPAGASPVGALDMSGNVTEWTRSHYNKGYPYRADDGREDLAVGDLPDRVTRGGSFSNSETGIRAAARDGADTAAGFGFIGFRVAISPARLVTSDTLRQ